jgi:chemotaxis regulatin CheY-phosphate phosphatase CheZ
MPAEQERIFMELIQKLATFKNIGDLVKALLEAKKVLKIKEVEKEIEEAQEDKTDAEERGEYMSDMLEVISTNGRAAS